MMRAFSSMSCDFFMKQIPVFMNIVPDIYYVVLGLLTLCISYQLTFTNQIIRWIPFFIVGEPVWEGLFGNGLQVCYMRNVVIPLYVENLFLIYRWSYIEELELLEGMFMSWQGEYQPVGF